MPRVAFAFLFAAVWMANGLLCKVLDLVPRHRQIVGRILGESHAHTLTVLIGVSEIVMAFWILSRWKWRWSTAAQIIVVLGMNLIEFILAPDLLLFGRWNAVVAMAYVSVVAYAGFFHAAQIGNGQP
jgi:DoxX-like family